MLQSSLKSTTRVIRQIGARIKRLFTRVGLDEMEVNFKELLSSIEKKIEE